MATSIPTIFALYRARKHLDKRNADGVSLIITINIVSRLPHSVIELIDMAMKGQTPDGTTFRPVQLLLLLVVFCVVTAATILLSQGYRRVPIQMIRKTVGKQMMGGSTYMPLKVNFANVMPIIFAGAILMLPEYLFQYMAAKPDASSIWMTLAMTFRQDGVGYMVVYGLLILAFSFFWVANQFNPIQIADNLKKEGAYIPGISPGQPTADFLDSAMTRVTAGGAVFLMALAILILYLSDFVVARKQYITVSGKSTRPNIVDLGKWRVPLTVLVSLFATIVVLIPFATILTTSFKIDVGKSLFDSENFTLTQWQTIFSRSETMSCLKNSLIFGVITASVGIVVACTMSYLLQRTKIRGRKLPDFLITLGSGTPSVVIALGLIMTMKGDFGVNIYNTAYIMIVAYLIKYLMMGMRTVVSAMSQIHVSLEECSQISGASWTRTMLKITGPLIFPSIAAGWFLIFIPSFYELSMTTLLYSNSTKTIGFQLYEYWTFTSQPQSCAMAFGILMIVVALNFLLNKLTKGEFSI